MSLHMNESEAIFHGRIKQCHVQRERMAELISYYQQGNAILLSSTEELTDLQDALEQDKLNFSNDMVIDMIIEYVQQQRDDNDFGQILQKLKIASIDDHCSPGLAYPKYSDDSYYIEISQDISKRMRLLGDLLAVLFMLEESLQSDEEQALSVLLQASRQRYLEGEEFPPAYNIAQLLMAKCDQQYGDNFTDRYVAYAREIYEMAMAFLIGHEIGHHFYGHTVQKPALGEKSQIAELKADGFALDFAFCYLKSAYFNENHVYGIHMFTGVYIPLLASQQLCNNIFLGTNSHPALITRLVGVQRGLHKIIDESAWRETQHYRNTLCQLIDFPLNSIQN